MGAAIQADELLHQGQQHILLDVTPLDLGLAIHGGKFHVIINKNTTIPCSNTTVFTTSFDNQTSLRIVVLQGEHTLAADNQVLAEFTFSGIRPAPAGTVDIEITFDVDADGIVNVIARDLETKQEHVVSIERSSNLTDEEIQQIRKENALAPIADVYENFKTNLVASLFLPIVPIALIVPVFGWIVSAAVLGAPFMVLLSPFQFIAACFEAVDIYVNFDASEYRSFAM